MSNTWRRLGLACRDSVGHILIQIGTNTHLPAFFNGLLHECEAVLHLYMFCVSMSRHSWKGAAAFPPERDCQWASLNPAVWQDARIISGDGGSKRGSRMEESKGEKGREGQWLCESSSASLYPSWEHYTQQCTFPLCHAITPPQRPQNCPLLCHTPLPPSLSFPPPILPSFTLHLWLTLSIPAHLSRAMPSLKHGALQLFISQAPDLSTYFPSSVTSFHLSPLLPFSPTLHDTDDLFLALSIIATWPTLNHSKEKQLFHMSPFLLLFPFFFTASQRFIACRYLHQAFAISFRRLFIV